MKYILFLFFLSSKSCTLDYLPEFLDPDFFAWCHETREQTTQPYDALINLGYNCEVAYQMRLHGLRTASLPFDWIITPFEALGELLAHNFANFLHKDSLVLVNNEKEHHILHTHYQIKFLHDFKIVPDFLKDYDTIYHTYQRRIERLNDMLRTSKKALFIRKKISLVQTKELVQLLEKLYPTNDFTLLVVDATHEIKNHGILHALKTIILPALYLIFGKVIQKYGKLFLLL